MVDARAARCTTRTETVAATSVVDTDLAHPASWHNSFWGEPSQAHTARIRGAVADKLTGTVHLAVFTSITTTSDMIINSNCATPIGSLAHVARVAAAREAKATAAGRSVLPRRPIVDECAELDLWSESMVDAADRVAAARFVREAKLDAPARRFAAALKRNKRKLSLSARAQRSVAAVVARMRASR